MSGYYNELLYAYEIRVRLPAAPGQPAAEQQRLLVVVGRDPEDADAQAAAALQQQGLQARSQRLSLVPLGVAAPPSVPPTQRLEQFLANLANMRNEYARLVAGYAAQEALAARLVLDGAIKR